MEPGLCPELWRPHPVPQVLPPGTMGVQDLGYYRIWAMLRVARSEQTTSILINLSMLDYFCPAQGW